jgi:hypothetical protein
MRNKVVGGVAATALVALITFSLLTLLGVNVIQGGQAHSPDEEPPADGGPRADLLLWSTRETLAICVEVGGEAALREGAGELQDLSLHFAALALEEVAKDPYWQRSSSDEAVANPIIDAGCPGEVKLDCPESPGLPGIACTGSEVTIPSPYRLFVFVLSEADLKSVTGPLTERRGTQEVICGGDECTEVTSVTWVSEVEVLDSKALHDLIAEGVGVRKPRD